MQKCSLLLSLSADRTERSLLTHWASRHWAKESRKKRGLVDLYKTGPKKEGLISRSTVLENSRKQHSQWNLCRQHAQRYHSRDVVSLTTGLVPQ